MLLQAHMTYDKSCELAYVLSMFADIDLNHFSHAVGALRHAYGFDGFVCQIR